MYPRKDSGEYKAGYQLNKILRHHIGKAGNRATNHETFRCNEGAWVILEDLIEQDFLWYDACDYGQARRHDQRQFLEIKRRRTGLIVDLAVAESRRWGKCRFQILGLRVDSYEEFRAVKEPGGSESQVTWVCRSSEGHTKSDAKLTWPQPTGRN